jgi:hypothetical protein
MFGIPNPYAIVGGLVLSVAALGGSYIAGRMDGAHIEQAAEAKADKAAQKVRDEKQGQIDTASQQHQSDENARQQAVREIDHEKQTIIERPVFSNVCLDDDGLRLLQSAADNANSARKPDAPDTAAAPAGPDGQGREVGHE